MLYIAICTFCFVLRESDSQSTGSSPGQQPNCVGGCTREDRLQTTLDELQRDAVIIGRQMDGMSNKITDLEGCECA